VALRKRNQGKVTSYSSGDFSAAQSLNRSTFLCVFLWFSSLFLVEDRLTPVYPGVFLPLSSFSPRGEARQIVDRADVRRVTFSADSARPFHDVFRVGISFLIFEFFE